MTRLSFPSPLWRIVLLGGLLAWSGASSAAQPPLREVVEVRNGIIAVGIAYELSERCDSIDARLFRGINYLSSLRARARDLGYSEAEIDAYINDDAEKQRLERIARAELASYGAVTGDPDSFCRVGRAQIANNTLVGWLLR